MGDCIFHMAPMESADLCWCSGQSILCGKMSILNFFHDYQIAKLPQIALVLQSPHQTSEERRGSYRQKLSIRLTGKWTSGAGKGQIQCWTGIIIWKTQKLCGDNGKGSMFWNFLLQYSDTLYYKASSTSWVMTEWFLL